jgi:uracil-DNA glycosylase
VCEIPRSRPPLGRRLPLSSGMGVFPFGAPVLACAVEVPTDSYPVAVVGAYPSAQHVRWRPPPGFGRPVAALPVDNEPAPFWDGTHAEELIDSWHSRFFSLDWGTVSAPAGLNGSSGRDLDQRWLRPLGYERSEAFITDCLSTARISNGVKQRLADRYDPVAKALAAPSVQMDPHPSEGAIVAEALNEHADRLAAQVVGAAPDMIVTLGNAAARVIAALGGQAEREAVLTPATYGQERRVVLGGQTMRWQALVHPATPKVWADRHTAWAGDGD